MSIRWKIILVNASIAFAITVASFGSSVFFTQERMLETVEKDLDVVSDIANSLMSAKINLLKADALYIAQRLANARNDDELRNILKTELTHSREFTALTIFDSRRRLAFEGAIPTPESFLHEAYLRRALAGEPVISTTILDQNSGGLVVYVCVPIDKGRALSATLPGLIFSDIVSEFTIWDSGSIFMLDEKGTVIASKNKALVLRRLNLIALGKQAEANTRLGAFTAKMLREESGVGLFEFGGPLVDNNKITKRICAFDRINVSSPQWTLGVQAPLEESPATHVKGGLLISSGILLSLGIIVAVASSAFIARPLRLIKVQNRHLVQLHQIARNASEAKSNFLANMSHEMRTPMNAIVGFSELMLGAENMSGEARANLEKIHSASMTLLSLINDILDLSKIESGDFKIIPVNYDTPSLINDTTTLNAIRIRDKPVTFSLEIDETFPGRLRGDDLRVKQICNNLLSNAFKYTKEGSVVWRIACERAGNDMWLTLTVTDTGIGIRPEDMAKLFTNYSRLDTGRNRRLEGTGLGLALTKRLAELMDGTVAVESEYGKGSSFTVRLRQGFVADEPIGQKVADSLKNFHFSEAKRDHHASFVRCRLPYARVLIVDDVQTNLDVAQGMMKPYGMQIDCVLSGEAAIEAIREEKTRYNAVFMDHMMPRMDGIEATRIIREEIGTEYAKAVPIIALTANAIVGNEDMFLNEGFQAFLTKPIDVMRLDGVLRQWVRDKEMESKLLDSPEAQSLWDQRNRGERRGAADRRNSADRRSDTIEGVDLKQGLERFDGDEETLLHVLASWATHTAPLLETLRACSREALPDYAIAVHGVKGSSRGICAEALGMMAENLEHAARRGDYAFVSEHNEIFVKKLETTISALKQFLESQNAKRQKPQKDKPDVILLDKLREACTNYDMDGVDEAMEELESCSYASGGELTEWLRECVDRMEFQKIRERLAALSTE
jgi:signal transduction histidine kinase/CheY-like chemotaxis protein